MAGKFDIYIIDVGGEYRVRPAVTMVEGSGPGAGTAKQLKIRNVTGHTAILAFPANFITGQDVVILAGKASTPLNLAQNLDGHYSYSVMISQNGELVPAKGESGPSVIVDP